MSDRSKDWDAFWGKESSPGSKRISWSKKRMLEKIMPYTRSGDAVLDAGCGSGFFSGFFCKRGLTVFAVDFSDEALDIARINAGKQVVFVKENLLTGDLGRKIGREVDLIFSDGLFEHFSDLEQDRILRNLLGSLATNGVIITFVPNQWSPWQIIRPFYMPGIKEKPFRLNALLDLHKRNGLNVLEFGGVNVFPWRFSPERLAGRYFGMLLYVVGVKGSQS